MTLTYKEILQASWDLQRDCVKEVFRLMAQDPSERNFCFTYGYLTAMLDTNNLPDGHTWFTVLGQLHAGGDIARDILSWK